MPAWGREDNIRVIANVVFIEGSTFVTNAQGNASVSTSGSFDFESNAFGDVSKSKTGGILAGDYIEIHHNSNTKVDAGKIGDSPTYQVAKVTNAIHIVLTTPASFSGNLVHPTVQQGPKYLANISSGTDTVNKGNVGSDPGTRNVYSIQRVYGIDQTAANVNFNKHELNIKTPGWVHSYEYQYRGNTRTRTEQLVAVSKNGIEEGFDYASHIHKHNLHFQDQPDTVPPSFTSNVAGANAHLFANAFAVPAVPGNQISYKWLIANVAAGDGFADVIQPGGAAGFNGVATNTLLIGNVTNVNGQVVICSATVTNEFGVIATANSNQVTILQTN